MSKTAADPASIAELCNYAGAPQMAAALIREGVTMAEAHARIDYAGNVRDVVMLARQTSPKISLAFADQAIANKMPLAKIREALLDQMAAANEAIVIDTHPPRRAPEGEVGRAASKRNMQKMVRDLGQEPRKP